MSHPNLDTDEYATLYTAPPQLHPNLLVSSLQLIFWLFIRPSAWQRLIDHIAPHLPSDFALSDLNRTHFQQPTLVRILLSGYLILPVLANILTGLVLWAIGQSTEEITIGIACGLTGSLLVGLAIGLASGVGTSIAGSIIAGFLSGIVIGVVPQAIILNEAGFPQFKVDFIYDGLLTGIGYGLTAGLMGSVAISISSESRQNYSFLKQLRMIIGGIIGTLVVSIFLSLIIAPIVISLAGLTAGRTLSAEEAATGVVIFTSGVAYILAMSLAIGLHTRSWQRGVGFGMILGLIVVLLCYTTYTISTHFYDTLWFYILFGMAFGVGASVLFSSAFSVPQTITSLTGGTRAGAITGALSCGVGNMAFYLFVIAADEIPSMSTRLGLLSLGLVFLLLGLSWGWWRPIILFPFLEAWNLLLFHTDRQSHHKPVSLLRFHSAFWVDNQWFRIFSLEEYLILVAKRNKTEGQVALEYVSKSRQYWAAQAAQIELNAYALECCQHVAQIAQVSETLVSQPSDIFLNSFKQVSENASRILLLERAIDQRIAAQSVANQLNNLREELTRSPTDLAFRFRPISSQWYTILVDYINQLTEDIEKNQEIESPYVLGTPIAEHQKIFVGRDDIGTRIGALLFDQQRASLLLYGQRRIGKTSLLKNLRRFLPTTLVHFYVFIDVQSVQLAKDHTGFLYRFSREIVTAANHQLNLTLPVLSRETLSHDPFMVFLEWLDEVKTKIEAIGPGLVLLALDEYELLQQPIERGRFDGTEILSMLRHIIQHHPRFKILLAGRHTLDELPGWSNYLINVLSLHLAYLDEAATRQLVEQPIENFPLSYSSEASQQVFRLTRGHPYLTQLLCDQIINLKNEQPPNIRRRVSLTDVEAAVSGVFDMGQNFFFDVENWVDDHGKLLLRRLANQGAEAIINQESIKMIFESIETTDQTVACLLRRELIEKVMGGYCFQVELIRRWFAERQRDL